MKVKEDSTKGGAASAGRSIRSYKGQRSGTNRVIMCTSTEIKTLHHVDKAPELCAIRSVKQIIFRQYGFKF